MRRTFWQLTLAAALLALLAVLGTLQYRWLGQVSDAERERLRGGLRARASELVQDFDRELTRIYAAFHVDPAAADRDAGAALADAYAAVNGDPSNAGSVAAVYLLDARDSHADVLHRLDPTARTLVPVDWPADVQLLRPRSERVRPFTPGALIPLVAGAPVDARVPALVVPIATLRRFEGDGRIAVLPDPTSVMRVIIVRLDEARLARRVADLVTRHFGAPETSEYAVAIVRQDDPSKMVYSNTREAVTAGNADLSMSFFDLRIEDLKQFSIDAPFRAEPGAVRGRGRMSITVLRRAGPSDTGHVVMTGALSASGWQVLVRPKGGSLETLVARSRRRNLAVGLGVLGLLATSFLFVVVSAQRQQRLARQQMEFVANVSHDLRTPLAVILSAGENLADGVVADSDQVRKYGSLVRAEGRRLFEMVERVMEFAGIGAGVPRARQAVDLAPTVEAAVSSAKAEASERGIDLVATWETPPGVIVGDADQIRSAIQNVLGNAVKYSADGSRVDLRIRSSGAFVRLVVSDSGIGIDAADLAHVFEPFFRGRRALDAQIRGSGIGLNVVRHIVETHGGQVRIESRPGEGTRVTIDLPLAPPARVQANEAPVSARNASA